MGKEFKPTQGDWILTQTPDLMLWICVDDPDHTVIATVGTVNPDDGSLMAAAPDLLAACEEFVRKCDCGEARSKASYAQMVSAINKAKRLTQKEGEE